MLVALTVAIQIENVGLTDCQHVLQTHIKTGGQPLPFVDTGYPYEWIFGC